MRRTREGPDMNSHLFAILLLTVASLVGGSRASAAEQPLPSLQELADKAADRERRFDRYRFDIVSETRDAGATDPLSVATTSWTRLGPNVRVEQQETVHLASGEKAGSDITVAYDGKLARAYSTYSLRGHIVRDPRE